MSWNPKYSYIIAACLLAVMAGLSIASMKNDAAIMDEQAHIPAGYSYLTQLDYRINPEHPPIIKDLAAIPLLFLKLNFPIQDKSWQKDINGQWDLGSAFLYHSDNNPDKIIFWTRIPMVLVMLLLGFYVYKWTKKLYGSKIAVFALFLYAFSPTVLAHGRFVTTDIGASIGFFVATYYFIKFLQKPTAKNIIIAGIIFGLAEMLKFSLFLLVPFFGFLLIVWLVKQIYENKQIVNAATLPTRSIVWGYIWRSLMVFIIGVLVIYPVYQFHILKYPAERQKADSQYSLSSYGMRPVANTVIWMSDKPVIRAYGQYLLGLAMVVQRTIGGNTTYFMGEVSGSAWRAYFPLVYLMKETLIVLFLILVSIIFLAWQRPKNCCSQAVSRMFGWLKHHFTEFAMICFIAMYWIVSIRGNLNIGVRHILPTFPFVYVLISGQVGRVHQWLKGSSVIASPCATAEAMGGTRSTARGVNSTKPRSKSLLIFGWIILSGLCVWYIATNLLTFPSYLTYFNEAWGGSKNGYKYVTDSNYDWGQDLKRLAQWVDVNNIQKINVDYFGGGSPEYYLGDKYQAWWGDKNPAYAKGSHLAVSATLLQQGRANPAPGFDRPTNYYRWLDQQQLVTRIGNSIFVYKIN